MLKNARIQAITIQRLSNALHTFKDRHERTRVVSIVRKDICALGECWHEQHEQVKQE